MGTVAFDAKNALVAKALADTGIMTALNNDTSAVWDSSYSGTKRPYRLLWFGETTWENEEPASLGMLKRVETFNIRMGIEIMENDTTQREANDKAKAVMFAFEAMMRDPRVLGIAGIESIGVVPVGIGEGPSATSGRATLLAAQVRIRARK